MRKVEYFQSWDKQVLFRVEWRVSKELKKVKKDILASLYDFLSLFIWQPAYLISTENAGRNYGITKMVCHSLKRW